MVKQNNMNPYYKITGKLFFKKKAKAILLIIFISILAGNSPLKSQEQGNLIIRNYTAKEYKAELQNWAMVQDKSGMMYFGNNNGVLQYDGTNWEIIPLPFYSPVRSLDIDNKGRIYVGAIDELGYIEPDSLGKMRYTSLVPKINQEDRKFKDVWFLRCVGDNVWFSTYKTLFRYRNGEFKTWKTQNQFFNLIEINKRIFTYETSEGIKEITEDSLISIPHGDFFIDKTYWSALSWEKDKMLIFTNNAGIYIYDFKATDSGIKNQIIKKFPTKIDSFLLKDRTYCSIQLRNGNIAIGTLSAGIIIINKKGKLIRQINKNTGLQGENSSFLFEDNENNLWITTMDKGISKTDINSPISYWVEKNGMGSFINDIIRFDQKLYFTNFDGIFCIQSNKLKHIPGVNKACFAFLEFKVPKDNSKKMLLVGTNYDGLVQIINDKILKLFPNENEIYSLAQSQINANLLFVGKENGMSCYRYQNNKWGRIGNIENINDVVRSIYENQNGNIWLSNNGQKLIQLIPSKNILKPLEINEYIVGSAGSNINKFNDQIIFGNKRGLFHFNEKQKEIIPGVRFEEKFYNGSRSILDIRKDKKDKIWISGLEKGQFGILLPDSIGQYRWLETPFNIIPEMQITTSYFDTDSTIWIAGSEGLFRFKGDFNRKYPKYSALIKRVIINNDSIIFFGNKKQSINENDIILPYKYNSIVFNYSATSYYDESRTVYQTFLEGFSEQWSEWTADIKKEYTNLPEGDYKMHVKAKNIYNVISDISTYSFTIKPPWYRTLLAYIIYIFCSVLFIWLIIILNSKRLKALNQQLEKTVKERTTDLYESNTQLEEHQVELEKKQEEIVVQRDAIENQNKELEKLSIVARETENAISIMDAKTNFLWFNAAYQKLHGYTLKEYRRAIGENLFNTSSIANIRDIVTSCIKDKKSVKYESEITTRTGEKVWTHVTITPILDDNNEVLKLISIESDIEKLKEYEKDILSKNEELAAQRDTLAEAVAIKDKFFSIISHDLISPFNSLLGFSEMLYNDLDTMTIDEKKRSIEHIYKSTSNIYTLIEKLLAWSRAKTGRIKVESQKFNLSKVIDDTIELMKINAHEKKITFKKNVKLNTMAYADVNLIASILRNLISNAIKFSNEKGTITIRARENLENIEISVSDEGVGISPENIKKLFRKEIFYSTKGTNNEKGTGLGLMLCKEFAEKNGGKIWVESEIKKGSIFQFTIPKTSKE